MDAWKVMQERHSVRHYLTHPIEEEKVAVLRQAMEKANAESRLHIQLFTEEPEAFEANEPHYGEFSNCRNYFAVIGRKGMEEKAGYYGEGLVLLAQSMGLNTCWVALTYHRGKVPAALEEEERILIVIALGYGEDQGAAHRSKPMEKLAKLTLETPEWFKNGVKAAMLAPTAINQQQFYFRQTEENVVSAEAKLGPCVKYDLGIVKYHFELGAGKDNFTWA